MSSSILAIVLKQSGKEKVHWTERRGSGDSRRTVTFAEQKVFYKDRIVMAYLSNNVLVPGTYVYPFQFQLPPNLPGSFDLAHTNSYENLRAKIEYKFTATVDVGGFFARDLKGRVLVRVFEQSFIGQQPVAKSIVESVNFMCCFNKGHVQIEAVMNKLAFVEGETAEIQTHVRNKSSVDVKMLKCKLRRVVTAHARGRRRVVSDTVCHTEFKGIDAFDDVQQPSPLPIIGQGLFPSTVGCLVQCQYYIDLQCDIPWCPDSHLELPVFITAPFLQYVHERTPPIVMAPAPAQAGPGLTAPQQQQQYPAGYTNQNPGPPMQYQHQNQNPNINPAPAPQQQQQYPAGYTMQNPGPPMQYQHQNPNINPPVGHHQ